MAKLFMLLAGCTPKERNIEQHDVFFGIGETISDVIPQLKDFWPGANKLHVDAWRAVTHVNGYLVEVSEEKTPSQEARLFFINLGGYKQNEFEEFHYKMIIAAPEKGEAIRISKQTAFFQHTGFKGANAHIDDKYGVDVDDVYEIRDILSSELKSKYNLKLSPVDDGFEDEIHLGYFKLDSF